jgi:hypothetical protein
MLFQRSEKSLFRAKLKREESLLVVRRGGLRGMTG